MQEKLREHQPLNLHCLIKRFTWEMETPTSSGLAKWRDPWKKKKDGSRSEVSEQIFSTDPSTAGISHGLISLPLSCMDPLESFNCSCNCSAPLMENPTTTASDWKMGYWEEFFPCEGGKALEWNSQRRFGSPIPGIVQGHVGQGLEQPGIVECVPAHGLEDLGNPFQLKPFHDSMIP